MTTTTGIQSEERMAVAVQGGDLRALAALRTSTAGFMAAQVQRYAMGPGHIPRAVFAAKADELLVAAAKSYDPKAGATFRTHLFNHLRRLDRFTKANANIAYKPEARANLLTNFNNQVAILTESKQRPPTPEEIADHMSLPLHVVARMQSSQRREIPWSQGEGATSNAEMNAARVTQVLDDVAHELTADELLVFNLLTGRGGEKKTLAGGAIAKATGFSQAKVSQLRTRIAARIQPLLGVQVRSAA